MKKFEIFLFSIVLSVVGAYADFAVQTETFESAEIDKPYVNWEGDGLGKEETIASYPTAGRPAGLSATSTKVLAVEGMVTNASLFTAMAENTLSQIDMMVKVDLPDDELSLPNNEEDAQIALGLDKEGRLNVYCLPKSGSGEASFVPISGSLENSTWVRVSFNFDYVNKLCQVMLNGNPCVSEYGVLSSKTQGTSGSWYKLNDLTATKISSMKVVGTTSIDDVSASQNTSGSPVVIPDSVVVADATTGANVKQSWLTKQGVATVTETAPDDSGMTVAQKYLAGLDVDDGIKFELKDLQPSATDSSKMVFSFPGSTGTGSKFKIMGCNTVGGTYSDMGGEFTAGKNGANNTVTIDVSSFAAGVKYFKIHAVQ